MNDFIMSHLMAMQMDKSKSQAIIKNVVIHPNVPTGKVYVFPMVADNWDHDFLCECRICTVENAQIELHSYVTMVIDRTPQYFVNKWPPKTFIIEPTTSLVYDAVTGEPFFYSDIHFSLWMTANTNGDGCYRQTQLTKMLVTGRSSLPASTLASIDVEGAQIDSTGQGQTMGTDGSYE